MKAKRYIAVDLGAESGKVFLGNLSDDKVVLEEVHRFGNEPIEQDGSLRWDFERLFSEVKAGIEKAFEKSGGQVLGIGVDSWGVDFGLLDEEGRLIENPYHYRDGRTDGVMEKAFKLMPKRQIYENSGLQFLQFNTIYQLLAMRPANSQALSRAKKLLFMADLISYFLTGRAFAEYTLASTSQLMDMRTGRWSEKIFESMKLPFEIMPDIVKPGTVAGRLKRELADEIGCDVMPVIAVASHDTASAVASVPAEGDRWAYISSGTWSLCGIEVSQAVINDKTFEYSFTNEGGVEGTIRLLKNIMGLWLVQQCRSTWQAEGQLFSYEQLSRMAEKAEPFAGRINPDDTRFLSPGDMPKKINEFLIETAQRPIEDKAQMIRVILESLALKTRWVVDRIEQITGIVLDCLHIVGGGIQNELLCRFIADATGKRVIAGPVEATAAGNILMQARATGQVDSLQQGRKIIRDSFGLKQYLPEENLLWRNNYERFETMLKD
jgi:rhamnulokinase